MTPRFFSLTPQDAWFFRDGRPYNHKESNQADVESVFPPPARTLTGALRAALARANGWSGTGRWTEELNRCFGAGPNDLGLLQFTSPFLIHSDATGISKALWPIPRYLLGDRNTRGRWTPETFLRPSNKPTETDQGPRCLPEIALPPSLDHDGLKLAEGAWITTDGLAAVLAGKLPELGTICHQNHLWKFEPRVGLARDAETLNVGEGELYSPSYVRLRRGVALGVGVGGVPEGMAHVPDIFPLGGESRLARCEEWGRSPVPALPSRERFTLDTESRVAFIIVLLTPGRFIAGKPTLPGAEIISACVGKPQFIGGWDSLKREPLPLEPFAPAGSVWFCAATPGDFDAIHKTHGRHIGAHTAHGFGQIAIGLWPPTFTNRL
jgi:CRISPR-associated protein Cmr3